MFVFTLVICDLLTNLFYHSTLSRDKNILHNFFLFKIHKYRAYLTLNIDLQIQDSCMCFFVVFESQKIYKVDVGFVK